jgi:hypothetical protein
MVDQRLKAVRSPLGRSLLPTAVLSRDPADWFADRIEDHARCPGGPVTLRPGRDGLVTRLH